MESISEEHQNPSVLQASSILDGAFEEILLYFKLQASSTAPSKYGSGDRRWN